MTQSKENFELSIVVPTYNESDNIKLLIPQIAQVFSDISYEVIVVDDQSPDGTAKIAEEFTTAGYPVRLISKKVKEGIGAALCVGYNESEGRLIASMDADLSFSVEDLRKLYAQILKGADLVVGSRYSDGGFYEAVDPMTRRKYTISQLGNRAVRTLTRIPLHDFSTNFRIIKKEVWARIQTKDKRNFFLFETILKTWLCGYEVDEVSVSFLERRFGKSKLNLSREAPIFFMKFLAQILINFYGLYIKRSIPRRMVPVGEGVS